MNLPAEAKSHAAYLSYKYAVIALGFVSIVWAAYYMIINPIDYRWLILAALTLVTSSCSIKIPTTNSKISVGDTFFFTNVILFGTAPGIITSALDGLTGSLRIKNRSRRTEFLLFNTAAMALSALVSGKVFSHLPGRPSFSAGATPTFGEVFFPLGILALTHYLCNSGSVAAITALESRQNPYTVWKSSFLWTSITYFGGAAAAGLIATVAGGRGPLVLAIIIPVVLAIYFTYKTYLDNVTQLKDLLHQVRHMAYYDSLTKLPNRALFSENVNQAIMQARRHGVHVVVMFIDIDRFKFINDTFGHSFGDALLMGVAERLKMSVRMSDSIARQTSNDFDACVGRFGGDEFGVLITEIDRLDDATRIAQRILKAFSASFDLNGQEIFTTVSIGMSVYPFDGTTVDALLKNADTAMYSVKNDGRNCFQYYSRAMNERSLTKIALENDMRKAIERGEFFLEYQPIIDAQTRRVVGTEALVRWQTPTRGTIQAAEFIPLAEECGLIVPIGEWVLRTACAQNVAWQKAGLTPRSIAVNLSCVQFRQKDLLHTVVSALAESGMDPRCLELEVTESAVMQNVAEGATTLNALKELGIRISIDDFGTGHSSLNYLKRLPLDCLKIDQSFVKDLATDPDDRTITKTIIILGHGLGLKVVAEGVDSAEQLAFLCEHDCDELQGGYFSRSRPANELAMMLEHEPWTRSVFDTDSSLSLISLPSGSRHIN